MSKSNTTQGSMNSPTISPKQRPTLTCNSNPNNSYNSRRTSSFNMSPTAATNRESWSAASRSLSPSTAARLSLGSPTLHSSSNGSALHHHGRKTSLSAAELADAYEREQEAITMSLLRRLEKLKREKVQIESELEAESENIVMKLTKQLAEVNRKLQAYENNAGSSTATTKNSCETPDGNKPAPNSQVSLAPVNETGVLDPTCSPFQLPSNLKNDNVLGLNIDYDRRSSSLLSFSSSDEPTDQITRLKQENNALRARIECLETELQQLKAEKNI